MTGKIRLNVAEQLNVCCVEMTEWCTRLILVFCCNEATRQNFYILKNVWEPWQKSPGNFNTIVWSFFLTFNIIKKFLMLDVSFEESIWLLHKKLNNNNKKKQFQCYNVTEGDVRQYYSVQPGHSVGCDTICKYYTFPWQIKQWLT